MLSRGQGHPRCCCMHLSQELASTVTLPGDFPRSRVSTSYETQSGIDE